MSVSMSKVAEMSGVSTTTVSYVINNKRGVSPKTVERVWDVIKKTGYVPRASDTRPQTPVDGLRTGTIGVFMADGMMSRIPLYARLFEATHGELESRNLKMSPILKSIDSDFSPNSFSDVDGVVLCSYDEEIARKLTIPFVSIFKHPDPAGRLYGDHVEPANDRIGAMAAQYFIDRGHKKLVVINPSILPHPPFESRGRCFVDRCRQKGIIAESVKVPFYEMDEQGCLVDGCQIPVIQEFISNFQSLSEKPTGIFVPCDAFLTIFQKSFAAKGIRPGIDVEFLGCNNDFSFFQGLATRPATIDIHIDTIAGMAVTALLSRITKSGSDDDAFMIINVDANIVKAGRGVKDQW
jgi:DNA-binding LacI/PurR family transcriptional regulator